MAPRNEGNGNDKSEATVAATTPPPAVEESKPSKPADLVPLAQTEEHRRALAAMETDVKVPQDLSKVSNAKAKELVDAGLVDDADLPGKMYRRVHDGFVTRIPNYIYDAYAKVHQEEWEEIKLTSDEPTAPAE